MKQTEFISFKDEILHIISTYMLLPLCLIALSFFIFSFIYFDSSILAENRNDNEAVVTNISLVADLYSLQLESIRADIALLKSDQSMNQLFLQRMIKFINRWNFAADFYLFDADCNVVLTSAPSELHFMPPHTGFNWGLIYKMNESPDKAVFFIFQNSLLVGKKIDSGYAVFVIPERYVTETILEKVSTVLILNTYNDVCLSSTDIFTGMFHSLKPEVLQSKTFFSFKKNWYFKKVSPLVLSGSRYFVYTLTPVRRTLIALLIEGIMLLVCIFLSGWSCFRAAEKAAVRKTQAVSKIVACLQEVEKNNFTSRMDIDSNDEFAIIADSYNKMIKSIRALIEKNKKISIETNCAQIKQLESQFNPHFLFNTLEIIKYMVKLEPESVPVVINSLSKLLRYSITVNDDNTTLSEDLEYTRNYLSIQKFRFTDRLTYVLDIADETYDCIVPKLILQPLIENAISYNLSGGRKNLVVSIKTYIKNKKIYISVTDDGLGMSEEKVDELEYQLKQKHRKTNHLGLYNINKRIRLLYKRKSGLKIISAPSQGTCILMFFPAIHKNGIENV